MSSAPAFSDPTWDAVVACGEAVENTLQHLGISLTMGGEPTFVPLQPDGAEWHTAALGPTKLSYARRFAQALIRRSHAGAVVLETSGKHYPGEPLPRWTLLVQRRADGRPLWPDPARLHAGDAGSTPSLEDAESLIRELGTALGLHAVPFLPLVEARPLSPIVGYVLPLDHPEERWQTCDWTPALGAGPIPLLLGDSPAGLRLPLARLRPDDLRRALTVEAQPGSSALTVFVPPLLPPAYMALLQALASCLAKRDLRDVVLAGYAPAADPELPTLGLASDPGVLEVNLTPCASWIEYDAQLADVYAAAAEVGLCARKLQYNGREVGTGGGAHLVFGGPPGMLSPFFAFPGLLPSIIRYWQRHPALSYAFTGVYLGPSSQAPRIDESTFEAMYELEIACAGAETIGSPQNLPLFDLLFRDLLMDRSGNTHRAEISVDKLWNPFAPNGRLGLVEFRAFETHSDRAVLSVVGLFIRAIITHLGAKPCRDPFVRWGGELHDRYFLPGFIWDDLAAICADLQASGLPFDLEWLRPAWEWRFPLLGTFDLVDQTVGAFTLEFRQALEAWPLLGETPGAGTVARTVDASLDRIEARVTDAAVLEHGILLVNGLPCAFRPTADGGAACGVRYRAFQLTPSLQPHVPVHAPLLIEWIDRATFTVVAAARWHVWNPRHTPYESRPRDSGAAAERRAERWQMWPHTLGQQRFITQIDFPPEGRHTLDLRRYPAQAR